MRNAARCPQNLSAFLSLTRNCFVLRSICSFFIVLSQAARRIQNQHCICKIDCLLLLSPFLQFLSRFFEKIHRVKRSFCKVLLPCCRARPGEIIVSGGWIIQNAFAVSNTFEDIVEVLCQGSPDFKSVFFGNRTAYDFVPWRPRNIPSVGGKIILKSVFPG